MSLPARALVSALFVCGCSASPPVVQTTSPSMKTVATADLEIYGVVPSFFGQQPFKAVTARLDSLKDLGINAIWLTPVYPSDDIGAISYSVTDYFHLRADLGSEDDFHELIRSAHARGIKVLMDFVPNHTSSQHPYFLDAQTRGTASPYYGFFQRDANGEPTHYFDWKNLENLNYSNPAVRAHIVAAFSHWLDHFDVDGFRVDAAWGVKERAPDFWSELTREIRKKHPDVLMLAEGSARDTGFFNDGFDLAYDWTTELGRWAWDSAFSDMEHAGTSLKAALLADPSPSQTVHFLNNNDTGGRFLTRHGMAATRVASVLMQTMSGVPILFSGDEVAAEYSPYDDPGVINWNDTKHFRDFQKQLISLRHKYSCLRSAQTTFLDTSATPAVLAYVRESPLGPEKPLLVVLNFGSASAHVLATSPFLQNDTFKDLLSNKDVQTVKEAAGWSLDIPAQSAMIIETN